VANSTQLRSAFLMVALIYLVITLFLSKLISIMEEKIGVNE